MRKNVPKQKTTQPTVSQTVWGVGATAVTHLTSALLYSHLMMTDSEAAERQPRLGFCWGWRGFRWDGRAILRGKLKIFFEGSSARNRVPGAAIEKPQTIIAVT